MSRRRILVVDDEPGMLRAVRRVLETSYEVTCVPDAEQAEAAVVASEPDLAILDIRMPGIDGFTLMDRLRQRHPDVDVVLMTGSIGETDRKLVRAIRKRAFYFIQKPFDREVLLALVERCFELRDLQRANERHTRRLERILAEARAFQESMIPPAEARFGSVRVVARRRSCETLCGDLFDYAAAADGAVAFLVADVSGHGASAAMLTGVVKSTFQACADVDFRPGAVVDRIASGIRSFEANRFVTLFCGRAGPRRGDLEYVNAGHPPGLLLSPVGEPTELGPTGPLVSPVLEGRSWTAQRCSMPEAGRLLLYTDGVTEAPGADGLYGTDRLRQVVAGRAGDPVGLLDHVVADVQAFMQGRDPVDDLTLLCVG